jgi:hypothetical protein
MVRELQQGLRPMTRLLVEGSESQPLTVLEAAAYVGIEPMNLALAATNGLLDHERDADGRLLFARHTLDRILEATRDH